MFPPSICVAYRRFDARSEFSSALSGAASDQVAKLEELSVMIRELAPPMPLKAPWIPEPALSFGQPGMHFMPVPAFTGAWDDDHTFKYMWGVRCAHACGHTVQDRLMTLLPAETQLAALLVFILWQMLRVSLLA
jgi:hypothetical protein